MCFDFCDNCKAYCTVDGNIPDPMNCMAFYQCIPPDMVHYNCPANEVFNPATKVCSTTGVCNDDCYATGSGDDDEYDDPEGPRHFQE